MRKPYPVSPAKNSTYFTINCPWLVPHCVKVSRVPNHLALIMPNLIRRIFIVTRTSWPESSKRKSMAMA